MRLIATLLMIGTVACNKNDESGVAMANESPSGNASASSGEAPTLASNPGAAIVDKDAVAALDKMGAYLRSLKTFQVRANTTRDEVLDNGQKVQSASRSDVLVQRPNKFRGESTSDEKRRMYFYDGKTFTLFADRTGYYASVPAPGNINDLSETLENKYDIELPLRDLFLWGTDRAKGGQITNAIDIGPGEVDGTSVEQYAFRQNGIDWQVWIQQGEYPLPRKLVITTTTDEARPDYTAVLSWNLAPSFNEAAFTFDPPADAKKIVLRQTDTAARSN